MQPCAFWGLQKVFSQHLHTAGWSNDYWWSPSVLLCPDTLSPALAAFPGGLPLLRGFCFPLTPTAWVPEHFLCGAQCCRSSQSSHWALGTYALCTLFLKVTVTGKWAIGGFVLSAKRAAVIVALVRMSESRASRLFSPTDCNQANILPSQSGPAAQASVCCFEGNSISPSFFSFYLENASICRGSRGSSVCLHKVNRLCLNALGKDEASTGNKSIWGCWQRRRKQPGLLATHCPSFL